MSFSPNRGTDIYEVQTSKDNIADLTRGIDIAPRSGFSSMADRLNVTSTKSLLSTRFPYDELPQVFTVVENTNGTLTYHAEKDAVSLDIGTQAGDKMYRSSNEFFHYQAYRETKFGAGIQAPPFQQGQRVRVGLFFEEDGFYFERDENGDFYVVRRSNGGDSLLDGNNEERVAQADWNLDTLLGSGDITRNPSRIELDFDKVQMVKGRLLWYGAGGIHLGLQIDNKIHWVHYFSAGNRLDGPIVGEPTLPLRWEIENVSAVNNSAQLFTFGASVDIEDTEQKDDGFKFGASNGNVPVSVGTTLTPILTIRPKAIYKGKTNRTKVIMEQFESVATDRLAHIVLVRNVTFSNTPDWQDVNPNSAVEYAVQAVGGGNLSQDTNLSPLGGGRERANTYATASASGGGALSTESAESRLPLVIDALGNNTSLNVTIMAQTVTQTTNTFGTMRWLEIQ